MRVAGLGAPAMILVAALCQWSCGSGPQSKPSAAPPIIEVVSSPSAGASARNGWDESGSDRAPATLRCGAATCVVGEQVCCHYEPTTFDVRIETQRDPKKGRSWCLTSQQQGWDELRKACIADPRARHDELGLDVGWVIASCDDSTDCADGEVCCFSVQRAEEADAVCTAAADCPSPAVVELCRTGSCRSPTSKCADVCSHEDASFACGLAYGVCTP